MAKLIKYVDKSGTTKSFDELFHIDELTGINVYMSLEHHYIHEGNHFFVSGFETEASAGTIVFGVTTHNKEAHMTFEVSGTSQLEMYIYEDATITDGTPATPVNNRRSSPNKSTLTIVKDPSISVAGTLRYSQSSGLAGSPPTSGDLTGLHDREREIVLNTNTTYTFNIISRDNNNVISYIGEWYEV